MGGERRCKNDAHARELCAFANEKEHINSRIRSYFMYDEFLNVSHLDSRETDGVHCVVPGLKPVASIRSDLVESAAACG